MVADAMRDTSNVEDDLGLFNMGFWEKVLICKHSLCEGPKVPSFKTEQYDSKRVLYQPKIFSQVCSWGGLFRSTKLEDFLKELRLEITKNIMIRYNLPRSLLEVVGRALTFEAMKQGIAKEKRLPNPLMSVAHPRD